MKKRILRKETLIPRPVEEVFSFFSKAENLNLITPTSLSFKIITPLPIQMRKGTLIDYKLKLFGIPIPWQTEITAWEPPFKFVDTQLKGPYALWVHEHVFVNKAKETLMVDTVEFLSPGGIFEPLVHQLFVKNNLKNIFDYRELSVKRIFN